MKKVIYLLIGMLLLSCSNPLDKKVNQDTLKEDLEIILKKNNLTDEDKEYLTQIAVGSLFSPKDFEGKTYRQLIEELKKEDKEKEELKKAEEKKEAEKQVAFNEAVTIAITSKAVEEYNYSESFVFGFALKNKSNKEIDAIKFSFEFYNKLGDPVGGKYSASITESINSNDTFSNKYLYDYNPFMNEDVRLGSEPLENLKANIKVEKIVYKDGSVLE